MSDLLLGHHEKIATFHLLDCFIYVDLTVCALCL